MRKSSVRDGYRLIPADADARAPVQPKPRVRLAIGLLVALGGLTAIGVSLDPGPEPFIERVAAPPPPERASPPLELMAVASRVRSRAEAIAVDIVEGSEPIAASAPRAVSLAHELAAACRADLGTVETQRYLSEHRRSDHGTPAWYFANLNVEGVRRALAELAWVLRLTEARLDASTDPDAAVQLGEVAAAGEDLTSSCRWPGWSWPASFDASADARVRLEACADGWEGLPARLQGGCYLTADDRYRTRRTIDAVVTALIDDFELACDRQQRCRDDVRGQERVVRPLRELRDHLEQLSDQALDLLAARLAQPIAAAQRPSALVPKDGHLFPLGLPPERNDLAEAPP